MDLAGRIARCKGCRWECGDYCIHIDARLWCRGNFGSIWLIVPFLFHVAECPLGTVLPGLEVEEYEL